MEDLARRIANLSPEKRLLLEIELQKKKGLPEPIAIVGLGCRLPGAENPRAFWQLLCEGHDAVREVPPDRWDVETFYDEDPAAPGKSYCRWGGFLDQVDQFDPEFFGIAPREVPYIDPQQRLFLEVVWEALEDAGIVPQQLGGSQTGVFAGSSTLDYGQLLLHGSQTIGTYTTTGLASTMLANRVSYLLNLRGPSLSIDTACSSSLVAAHLACQSLWRRETDLALAGGVNLILTPALTVGFSKLTALSPDGHCKAFDASANGFVRSEGVGVVVLKRLSQALADGDRIYALIRGSAVNQDGRTNGLTAPNREAQEAVLRQAYQQAGVALRQVEYIEAHGTGTLLGDPIEAKALGNVFQSERSLQNPVRIGSLKSNIGHTEAAAGVASLIKVALCLKRRTLVPSIHFHTPNPYIPFDRLPLRVQQVQEPWTDSGQLPVAGVSSFSFGGSNAHMVLQAVPDIKPVAAQPERPRHLLTLSAPTAVALRDQAHQFSAFLKTADAADLASICYTANVGRTAFSHRLAIAGTSPTQLADQLAPLAAGDSLTTGHLGQASEATAPEVVFLFTGQGSQYWAMGRQLYETQPDFRAALERCDELLRPYLSRSLLAVLFEADDGDLSQTQYTQPALFAIEYALAQLWRTWGVEPAAVLGHSVGEYVAACIAGVFSLEDGLRLIAQRGKLMQSLPAGGGMAAIFADEATVAKAIAPFADTVSLATLNGPENTVIAGVKADVQQVLIQLRERGIGSRSLDVSHAFHSPLMDPVLNLFEHTARRVPCQPAQIPLVSNLTGQFLAAGEVLDGAYWRRQAREPVRFGDAIATLQQAGYRVFLEIGPQPILSAMGKRCIADPAMQWLPSLRKGTDEWETLLASLGCLYCEGVKISWAGFDQPYQRRKLSLPTYPFQRQRYWIDLPVALPPTTELPAAQVRTVPEQSFAQNAYQLAWQPQPLVTSANPAISGRWLIFSDPNGLGEALAAQIQAAGGQAIQIRPGDGFCRLATDQFQLSPTQPKDYSQLFQSLSADADAPWSGALYLWGLANTSDRANPADHSASLALLTLLQHLLTGSWQPLPQLWLVTQSAQAVTQQTDLTHPSQAALWGLGRTLRIEHPELWGGLVDLDADALDSPAQSAQVLVQHLLAQDGEDEAAFRQGQRHVARLETVTLPEASAPLSVHGEGTYLITGGTGALGLIVARWLVAQGARSLVLVSRSGVSAQHQPELEALRQTGTAVWVEQADVAKAAPLEALLQRVRQQLPPLRGVLHAAGTLADSTLLNLTAVQFTKVMTAKVEGAWNLHQATLADALDWFVSFSSIASLLGSPGQGNYAAANAVLDALAHYRQQQGLPAQSLSWGPWAGAGMAAGEDAGTESLRGLQKLSSERGLALLRQALTAPQPHLGLAAIDWAAIAQSSPFDLPPLLSRVLEKQAQPAAPTAASASPAVPKQPELLAHLLTLPTPDREAELTTYLQREVGQVLGLQGTAPVDRPLLDLGIDSLMTVDLLNLCKRDLKITLYPREVFAHPTIQALAQYMAKELVRSHPTPTPLTLHPSTPPPSDPLPEGFWTSHALPEAPPQRNRSMVFLLSSPRSGSTLLRVMLAGHPQLFCPPELHLLPFDTLGDRHAALGGSYLEEGLQRALMELMQLDADATQSLVSEWMEHNAPVQAIYDKLQQLAGDRLLVDKSPTYSLSLATLQRSELLFENARFIHLVRHPYAVIDSFVKNRMHKIFNLEPENPYQLAEQVWDVSNRNIQTFLQQVDPQRQQVLRYEDLVTDPETAMRQLCAFLELPFDPAVLTPYEGQRMTDGVRANSMAVDDPNFRQRRRIEANLAEAWRAVELPLTLTAPTQALSADFGYELPRESTAATTPRPELPQVGEPLATMREETITLRGLQTGLCTWGLSAGQLILCLHGILDQGAAWDAIASPLADRGYRIIAPDLRGHGRSSHVGLDSSYQFLDFLGDIDALLRDLPETPLVLVGHSMGAVLAATLASLRPERFQQLMLIEPVVPGTGAAESVASQLTAHLGYLAQAPTHPTFPDLAAAAARLRQFNSALPEAAALKLAERLIEPHAEGVRWRWDARLQTRTSLGIGGAFSRQQYEQLLQQIQMPTLLVYGSHSQFNRPEDLALQQEALPQAQRIMLEGGHNLPAEVPGQIAALMLNQLSGNHS
ncbi:type I polyketide synthase [Pseudanabaena sp. FACHB-2040]|uniref:type I polyketide synthase n=1 Tax=Pseudanabaena sp. FACHB-2040 TaxID=2692859 RepID=UPI001683B32D|nr:alpha/beta fold hydrolase [Pseudanabaena sp. FACHB-2040]